MVDLNRKLKIVCLCLLEISNNLSFSEMNILISLYLLVPLLHLAHAGPFFKAGFVKGALKGLLKGQQQNSDDRQCQVKWEEVWKPHCSTSYEQVIKEFA